jgi:hypothetical protein
MSCAGVAILLVFLGKDGNDSKCLAMIRGQINSFILWQRTEMFVVSQAWYGICNRGATPPNFLSS